MFVRSKRLVFAALLFLTGCAVTPPAPPPAPLAPPPGPLIKLAPEKFPSFDDDAATATLRTAALQSLVYYRSRPAMELYTLATDTYTAAEMTASMAYFVEVMDQAPSREAWKAVLQRDFQVYQSAGTDAQQTVTFSSYYEPTIPGRLKRSPTFRYPIYGRPKDLIEVDLGQFEPSYPGARISGRVVGQSLVPYYTRADIDSKKALQIRKAPIVAWAKTPTDIFFMQIEGSGWLDLGNGKTARIRYAGNNGRKYRSVGLHVISTGRIAKEEFSHDGFERYLNDHPKDRQGLLNVNPRYVFFWIDRSTASPYAYGNIQVPLTPHRSIATDPKIFPKGGLAWIETDHPILDAAGKTIGMKTLTRFVLNQDEGGAIQGPGRVDYFAGSGAEAHTFATHFWQKGKLYFLVKKK